MSTLGALLLCHCSSGSGAGSGSIGAGGMTSVGSGGLATSGAPTLSPMTGGSMGSGGNLTTGGATASAGAGGGAPMATGGTAVAAGGVASMPVTPPTAGTTGAGGMGSAGAPASTGGSAGAAPAGPAVPSAGCGKADVPASGNTTIDVDGTARQYIVTVPNGYDPSKPYRLIFAWHGLGGTAMQMASSYYGLLSRSAGSAIFIAGQGLPGTGQQSGLASWSNTGDGDITFTRKMLDWAKANFCIDTKRVFSIGMSNGGLMSNVVGCELGDSFRAIVAMSGGGPKGYAMKPCTGQLAVWLSHGNMDNNVPFSYGEASRDYWAKANHCGTQTVPVMPGTCVEFQGCDPGFPVDFCEFDGGHMVPSFAAEAGWNFFARF